MIQSVERVDAMTHLPQEKPMDTDDAYAVPPSWPQHGKLTFQNVCLRYREGLPLALNNFSFTIPPGSHCGVVGRTGAGTKIVALRWSQYNPTFLTIILCSFHPGKSSLTVALFRIVELESGQVTLDDIDLANLGLADVRGRPNGMAIIPQDPFLAGSTLRECLDPFGQNRDTDVLEALKAVRLANPEDTVNVLDTVVEEGGSNFSQGERQLLNLGSALLSKPKLLVLDEATSSIDSETDAFVQKIIRSRFKDITLITVAHRLNTIMDYDQVLVMDRGRAVEGGSPAELLARNGVFAELVDATGKEGSKALRAMV
jgi:ABC-type multidrug transport system fused ATPase/permease subunit